MFYILSRKSRGSEVVNAVAKQCHYS